MIGAWGRRYRGDGKLVHSHDAEEGREIKAVASGKVTGARMGTRPIRVVRTEEG